MNGPLFDLARKHHAADLAAFEARTTPEQRARLLADCAIVAEAINPVDTFIRERGPILTTIAPAPDSMAWTTRKAGR